MAAAATHGIIRTSHAARSLATAEEDDQRRDELARALAYWAASYLQLPVTARPGGTLDPATAIRELPVLDRPDRGGMITARLEEGLPRAEGLDNAVAALRRPAAGPGLRALAAEFTRVFLGYGRAQPITFLHAVTAPVAAYSALPLLPPELARPTYDALWQVGAALYAVHAGGVTPEPLPATTPPQAEDLADRAVATGDEHAIKLTEACLRLHAEIPDPVCLTRPPAQPNCSASLTRMAKAGRARRAKKTTRDRQRARQAERSASRPPASEPASRSGPGDAPSQQDLVAAAIGAAVQAVCDGSRDPHGAHLDPLAIERTPGWTRAVSRGDRRVPARLGGRAWRHGWQPAELVRQVGRERGRRARRGWPPT